MRSNAMLKAIITLSCVMLMSISIGKEVKKEKMEPLKSSFEKNEKTIRMLIVNCPLSPGAFEQLLNNIWERTKSEDRVGVPISDREREIAWETLYTIWKFSDGGRCHFFTRFCWFICKDEPPAFYLRYLSGDKRALHFYELASMYDIGAFKEDKITKKEFMNVLERVKHEIENYNKKKSIKDKNPLQMISHYLTEAKRQIESVNEPSGCSRTK